MMGAEGGAFLEAQEAAAGREAAEVDGKSVKSQDS